jgi:hypothetical protein
MSKRVHCIRPELVWSIEEPHALKFLDEVPRREGHSEGDIVGT